MKRDTQNNPPGSHHLHCCDGSDVSPGSAGFLPALPFPSPLAATHARDQQEQEVSASPPPNHYLPSQRSTLQTHFDTDPQVFASNRSCLQRRCRQNSHAGHMVPSEPPWWVPWIPASVPVTPALSQTTRRPSAPPHL